MTPPSPSPDAPSQRRRVAEVRREFDRKARHYESGRLATWYQAQGELVMARLRGQGGPRTSRLLDVGCGTGWLLRRWAERGTGLRGVGVDLSPRMVGRAQDLARREGVRGLDFLAADWEEEGTDQAAMTCLEGSAQVVTCVSAFHYFSNPAQALRLMVGALAPGGTLLLLDRAVDQAPLTLVWDLVHRTVLADHVRFHRTTDLRFLMEGAGLEDVRVAHRVRRLLWKGKLETSLVLLSGRRSLGDGARILEDP